MHLAGNALHILPDSYCYILELYLISNSSYLHVVFYLKCHTGLNWFGVIGEN